jgi:hypothetical protein
MAGCIALFERIDPKVERITTYSGADRETGWGLAGTAYKSNRIGHVHYMFEAFKRQHGRKPTMRELVEFAIGAVNDNRSRGIWRELLNGITSRRRVRAG